MDVLTVFKLSRHAVTSDSKWRKDKQFMLRQLAMINLVDDFNFKDI